MTQTRGIVKRQRNPSNKEEKRRASSRLKTGFCNVVLRTVSERTLLYHNRYSCTAKNAEQTPNSEVTKGLPLQHVIWKKKPHVLDLVWSQTGYGTVRQNIHLNKPLYESLRANKLSKRTAFEVI